jgi:hypothetical protein
MKVGESEGLLLDGLPISLSNVTLSLHPTLIGANAVVLAFRLQNEIAFPLIAHIGVTCDLDFDENVFTPVMSIGVQEGFVMYSSADALTFTGRRAPLTTDLSTYWFGYYSQRLNFNWTQVQVDSVSDMDSALSFCLGLISIERRSSDQYQHFVKLNFHSII